MKIRSVLSLAVLGIFALGNAAANDYPNKPIKLIVPFAPGGTTDIVGRLVADKLGQALGQPVIVENRAGAGGAIGADSIAKAAPDGYTLGLATVSTVATIPACNNKLSYDPIRDYTFITNIAGVPNVVTINPTKLPAKDFAGALKLIKEKPGQFNYASPGACSLGHMMGELFEESTKAALVHIPYKGAGPALADLLGGQVEIMFDNLPSSLPYIKSGKLVALAVAAPKRVDGLPNVPTFAEAGHASVNDQAWYGLVGPANIAPDVVKKLNEAVVKILAQSDVKAKLETQSATAIGSSPADFKKQAEAELNKMKNIVKTKKIRFDD